MARGLVAAALWSPARLGASTATSSYTGRSVRATARPVGGGRGRRRGGLMVVRAGGPPSTNQLILAFVLPFSLFVGTLVTAARVADDLDERFLREMEINKAIMEENEVSDEEEDDDGEYDDEAGEEDEEQAPVVEEKEAVVVGAAAAAATRTRNRPRRQV